jgi:hypothetical protein
VARDRGHGILICEFVSTQFGNITSVALTRMELNCDEFKSGGLHENMQLGLEYWEPFQRLLKGR